MAFVGSYEAMGLGVGVGLVLGIGSEDGEAGEKG